MYNLWKIATFTGVCMVMISNIAFNCSFPAQAIYEEPSIKYQAPKIETHHESLIPQVIEQHERKHNETVVDELELPDAVVIDTSEYTTEITMLAKTMFGESRGVWSQTEQAGVAWTILNRYDAGYGSSIAAIITAPHQFAYSDKYPTVDDYGRDLEELAKDVIIAWIREKNGDINVGRVLPSDYLWYSGDGKHNYFRNQYKTRSRWDWSLGTPYES